MAFNNKEIEIKIKLDDLEFTKARQKLIEVGTLQNTMEQVDTYFAPKSDNYLLEKYPFKWLSIRQRSGKSILNFKHFHPERAEKHTHCDEFETEITNAENMKSILEELQIVEVVEVNKKRETFLIDDRYEIVLDTVKGLGSYLEIEAMKDLGNPEITKEQMMDFLTELGIAKFTIDYRGYPFELLKLSGKL